MKKILALLLGIAMVLTLAGCSENQLPESVSTPKPEEAIQDVQETDHGFKTVTMLGFEALTDRKSDSDILTDIWREKTNVKAEIQALNGVNDYTAYITNAVAGNSLPDIIAVDEGIFDVEERFELLKNSGFLLSIPFETAKEYMPQTIARLERMGISFEDWYYANADEDTGEWYYIPTLPSPLFQEDIRDSRYGIDNTEINISYIWIRDDILNTVEQGSVPASTIETLYDVYADNMNYAYIDDSHINSLDDLSEYLKRAQECIKAYGLDVGVIHPAADNSAAAIKWSGYSFADRIFDDMPLYPNNIAFGADDLAFFESTDEWHDYLLWLNTAYNNGWITDFMSDSSNRRSYAVMNWWLEPKTEISPITGNEYGWRLFPAFTSSTSDGAAVKLSLETRGAVGFNAKRFDQDDLEWLLKWADWNYSLEAQELRNWGVDLSEGEGQQRRFKDEYDQVADYMLSGISGENDGWKYGLVNTMNGSYEYWNHEVYGVCSRDVGYESPFYVYDLNNIKFDQRYFVPYLYKKDIVDKGKVLYIELDSEKEEKAKAVYAELEQEYTLNVEIAMEVVFRKLITCSGSDFEKEYKSYMELYNKSTLKGMEDSLSESLKQLFEK